MTGAPLGVVTVTYNSEKVLEHFLSSVLAQKIQNWRLYVVDNASKDLTWAILSNYSDPRLIKIECDQNKGFAAGSNVGIKQALADGCGDVLLLNNDTEFGGELFAQLLIAKDDSGADIVAPKILEFGTRKISYGGGCFNRWRNFAVKHWGQGQEDCGQCDKSQFVEYASGCCLLLTRHVLDEVGFLDEAYFVYWEDADYCYSAGKRNCKIYYDSRAVINHKTSSLTGLRSDFSIQQYTRNKVYFLLKNLGAWGGVHVIFFELYLLVSSAPFPRIWLLRQKSFFEGLSLYLSCKRIGLTEKVHARI